MKDRPGRRPSSACLTLLCVLSACSAVLAQQRYLPEDVRIDGRSLHAAPDAGPRASVLLGDFRLQVGRWTCRGRDAVLWIRPTGGPDRERILTVYVEGDARVTPPDGPSEAGEALLLTIRHRGRVRAFADLAERPLRDFPLVDRAVEARAAGLPAAEPVGVRLLQPDARHQPPPDAPPAPERPEETPPPEEPAEPVEPTEPPQPEPVRPEAVQPIRFSADEFSVRRIGTGDTVERAWIARGNVYLYQGAPDTEEALELRSQAAVIFTRLVDAGGEDRRVPYRPELRGLEIEQGREERVVGAYLEGDVVIARGERYLRAPRAYYDFTTDRSLALDPVFRTVQEQRNIPIYVRAEEARTLSVRELWFRNAKVTTSDFRTPTYALGARRARLTDLAEYDVTGERITPPRWQSELRDGTFQVRGVPVAWLPYVRDEFEEGHTALRKLQIGRHTNVGWGVYSEWHLFRLLGLVRPEGFRGRFEANWTQRGPEAGLSLDYSRRDFSGYMIARFLADQDENDDFGETRKNVPAPETRGRLLVRHKQELPRDWTLQLELSYLCDRNYLEQFFPEEFDAGKEQETLAYARKQRDNWALDVLLKSRLNRFQTQPESAPDLGFHLLGEPLLDDRLTFFSESHLGAKRWRPDDGIKGAEDTRFFTRADTRNEINWPLHFGPVNVVPYATGRATYWGESVDETSEFRPYGQLGVRANLHVWRVFPNASSRLLDVHGLRHVITPEAVAFVGEHGGVEPSDLFPMNPDIEEHLRRQSGVAGGVYQRLQTKRGPEGAREPADWMRLNLLVGTFDNGPDRLPADGRLFVSRPEYSLGRNFVNGEYIWNISDTTVLTADANYDMDTGQLGRHNVGLAVRRDPRLRYYVGVRTIRDVDSTAATVGASYRINPKYTISGMEQYDLDFDGGRNLVTTLTVVRKLPRWFAAFTVRCSHRDDDVSFILSIWPEGIPELSIGGSTDRLLGESDRN